MLAKLLLWVCLLSLNQDIHWREGTTLVMLAKLLLWVCLLSLNQDIHWRECTALVMLVKTASMSMLTLFESRYTLKGRYSIGNVGKTASMSMLTLCESRYTLKGRYSIGNVGASMSMLTLFESRYTLKGRYSIGNVGKTASMSMLTLFESRYALKGLTCKSFSLLHCVIIQIVLKNALSEIWTGSEFTFLINFSNLDKIISREDYNTISSFTLPFIIELQILYLTLYHSHYHNNYHCQPLPPPLLLLLTHWSLCNWNPFNLFLNQMLQWVPKPRVKAWR